MARESTRSPIVWALLLCPLLTPGQALAGGDDDLLDDLGPVEPKQTAPVVQEEAPVEEVQAAPVTDLKPAEKKPEVEVVRPDAQDRIKAVPRKAVLKRGRFEVSSFTSLTLNDAYYQHLALSGSAIFYPHDAFGIGIGADYLYVHAKTDNLDVVRQTMISVPAQFEQPRLLAHLDLYWVPIYGKMSLFNTHIIHFEFYGSTGVGVATAFGSRRPPAVNAAIGQRFFLGDWLALRFEVRDHLFVDTQTVDGAPQSDIQSYVMFLAGASFFIPPSFEYSYR